MLSRHLKVLSKGVFAVNKYKGVTSAGVVEEIKHTLCSGLSDVDGRLKVGHGGVLDNTATGVLVIATGEGCRVLPSFLKGQKKYTVEGRLGIETDSYNEVGKIVKEMPYNFVTEARIKELLMGFKGRIMQVPPKYSALKLGGQRLSDLAKKGVQFEVEPRPVQCFEVDLLSFTPPYFMLSVECGGGFYVRMSEPEVNLILEDAPKIQELRNSNCPSGDSSASSSDDATTVQSDESRFRNFDNTVSEKYFDSIQIPIVGYEVMEERAKFTVFKLRVENARTGEYWFVFRRYTDFVRLHAKIKSEFSHITLLLPRKKWFGDNFNPRFLEERIEGLQDLIDSLLKSNELTSAQCVKDFFCLDEPPTFVDSIEESRAVIEALEEKVFHLKKQLREKETEHENLKIAHSKEIDAKLRLASFVQECTRECQPCAVRLSTMESNCARRTE